MLGYLSADVICSEKRIVFRERSSRKTASYEEQILPKDKYPSIFSPKMEAIVFIILRIFFATHKVLKIGEYSWIFPSFSWGISENTTQFSKLRKRFEAGHNQHNSLHLGRKYARIFVLGHYLFLVADSFPRASLSENCSLLGTDNVRGQISVHIFAPNGGYCLSIQFHFGE